MKKAVIWVILSLAAAGVAWLIWQRPPSQATSTVTPAFQITPDAGFKRALGPVPFSFPLDYGPHPDFQTEWWYYTGNLQTKNDVHFGFELTFFRRALVPPSERQTRASDLATDQVYMAHFAFTDVQANRFYYQEHFSRGAGGLAGATGLPAYKVWLNDWQIVQTAGSTYRLSAAAGDFALDLDLNDLKGPILQGDRGYSQKGAGVGDASYYFSQTRLQTSGTVRVGNVTSPVEGFSWMDHEYSTSALSDGQVGWNWFALQFEDGSELTAYTIRRSDGSIDPYSRGMIINKDGSTLSLTAKDFQIQSNDTWKSPSSGAVYPSRWTVNVPGEKLILDVTPTIADQELRVSFVYWEGAVKITGSRNGVQVSGSGYAELTGYAQSLAGQF